MLWLLGVAMTSAPQVREVPLTPGMMITTSVRIKPGTYRVNGASDTPITISGNNITVDFQGATLRGSAPTVEPDERAGTAIRIIGTGITLKNANIHGFKVAVHAEDSPAVSILDSDFSYNWKQRLKSTLAKEDTADWMSYHANEEDEWLRFGAGIYLRDCDRFEVKNVTIRGGQCGLMLTECDGGTVWNNDFSFLSAVGLGMYRSSNNRIFHNAIDYCVRGYSHGVYNRGQDSTGILIYEQSHHNQFAYNSVTHGGDGFFLWAGQTTMDSGQGGCNDNLVYGNDFSHAPTNGIEATFSRNRFINNLVMECWHGVWGGYSYDTDIIGNTFAYNAESIAIEHGQDNKIVGNSFFHERMGLNIWMNDSQDPNWGYPKNRDTASRDYTITDNRFDAVWGPVFRFRRTAHATMARNVINTSGELIKAEGENPDLNLGNSVVYAQSRPDTPPGVGEDMDWIMAPEFEIAPVMQASGNNVIDPTKSREEYMARFNLPWSPFADKYQAPKLGDDFADSVGRVERLVSQAAPQPMPGGRNVFDRKWDYRGRRYILVDEWGPHDFQSPVLWPRLPIATNDGETSQTFELIGPAGQWEVVSVKGAKLSANSGSVPGYVTVTTDADNPPADLHIRLRYRGERTVDYRGVATPARRWVPFEYRRTYIPISWTVKHWAWVPEQSDPRTQKAAFDAILAGAPLAEYRTSNLDIAAYGEPYAGVPADHYATVAEGKFRVPAGRYRVKVTTDDGCRISLDGKTIIESWQYQAPTNYTAEVTLTGDPHTLKAEHFEINGYSALKVEIEPID